MILSNSFSEKTSSTLPIIISFSTNLKSRGTRKIRDFLRNHPNCTKYITKGPNFVADDNNEFRLYYVDSSLYKDERTLKKLNIQKEEIVFDNTSASDSLEISTRNRRLEDAFRRHNVQTASSNHELLERTDKSIMCSFDMNSNYSTRTSKKKEDVPKIAKKVSKSFQIGPDLRFNVVYINTETPFPVEPFQRTNNVFMQTESLRKSSKTNHFNEKSNVDACVDKGLCQLSSKSRLHFQIRKSPSFICEKSLLYHPSTSQVIKKRKKLTTFKNFCSRMESRNNLNRKHHSIIDSRNVSVRRSPSFFANYVVKILEKKRTNGNVLSSEIFESIFNYVGYKKQYKGRIHRKDIYDLSFSSTISTTDINNTKNRKQRIYKNTLNLKSEKPKRIKEEKLIFSNKMMKPYYSVPKHRNCDATELINDCFDHNGSSKNKKVEILFKKSNFLGTKSHYAILKRYHEKLRKISGRKRSKNKQRKYVVDKPKRYIKNKPQCYRMRYVGKNENVFNYYWPKNFNMAEGCRTRTTISGFLHSFKPWHWIENSKLSLCVDEDCLTEETTTNFKRPPYRKNHVYL